MLKMGSQKTAEAEYSQMANAIWFAKWEKSELIGGEWIKEDDE